MVGSGNGEPRRNLFFQFCYMADDTYQAAMLLQLYQTGNGAFQRFAIQCAKAFVDEYGVELHTACSMLHGIGKP